MAKPLVIKLNARQKADLKEIQKQDPKAYMRERAPAILKIASGQSGLQVAQQGLLLKRDPDTVYSGVRRYRREGKKRAQDPSRTRAQARFFPSLPERRGSENGPVTGGPSDAPTVGLSSKPLDLADDQAKL